MATDKPKIGWPHGAFTRQGRWVPNGYSDPLVVSLGNALLHLRRNNSLSPGDYLLRVSRSKSSKDALQLLGPPYVGLMTRYDHADDWGPFSAASDWCATDAASFLVTHCGRPYPLHHWSDSGQWVPTPKILPPPLRRFTLP